MLPPPQGAPILIRNLEKERADDVFLQIHGGRILADPNANLDRAAIGGFERLQCDGFSCQISGRLQSDHNRPFPMVPFAQHPK